MTDEAGETQTAADDNTSNVIVSAGLIASGFPALVPEEIAAARRYRDASRAESTRAKYSRDWVAFSRWCRERGHEALPAHPAVVAVFLSYEADRGVAPPTIGRVLAAISYHHRQAGQAPPHRTDGGVVLLEVLAGIRRCHRAPRERKAAADAYVVHAVLRAITGNTLKDVRDRAIVAFGMASALRRSELVALTVADLEFVTNGLRVCIQRSKTDQESKGTTIAVPNGHNLRPVSHLEAWLRFAGITEGPIFRRLINGRIGSSLTGQSIALILKARVAEAGYSPEAFSAHSLRAGFLTSAASNGASIWKMREVSRHKSVQVLSEYIRNNDSFKEHAGEKFL
ncbi:MAG: site-specific integrase [Roseomonas sp.]|nr:site-specific integrase [Roseomonas sp.]